MKTIWIHLPEAEAAEPCVLQIGSAPRTAGPVYEVSGRKGRVEAQNTVKLALAPEPDVDVNALAWARWKDATKAIRLVGEEEF